MRILYRIWPQLIGVAIVIIAVIFLSRILPNVRVGNIRCETQYGPCPDTWDHALEQFYGQSLFTLSDWQVRSVIKELPGVKNVKIAKRFPNILRIIVDQSKPYVAGYTSSGIQLLDKDAVVVANVQNSSLPKLSLASLRGEKLETIKYAISVLSLLSRGGYIGDGKFTSEGFEVTIGSTKVIMPSSHEDLALLVGSLQFMLSRFTIEEKVIVKIDMRFKNPVVVFQ